jgi:hypothetical protein
MKQLKSTLFTSLFVIAALVVVCAGGQDKPPSISPSHMAAIIAALQADDAVMAPCTQSPERTKTQANLQAAYSDAVKDCGAYGLVPDPLLANRVPKCGDKKQPAGK